MDFAHTLDEVASAAYPFIFAASVLVWGIGLAAYLRTRTAPDFKKQYSSKKLYAGCIIIFLALIGLVFLTSSIVKTAAETEIGLLINARLEGAQVNGKPFFGGSQLLADIRSKNYSYHHSQPALPVTVTFQTSQGELKLILKRDSERPDEYWLFYPAYKITMADDIGKVVTTALDGY